MKRHVMLEVFTKGVSIFEKTQDSVFTSFLQNGKTIWGEIMRNYVDAEEKVRLPDEISMKVVRYRIFRGQDMRYKEGVAPKEEETMEFKRSDVAKHLLRLAIVHKSFMQNRVVIDNLLYVSDCHCGMAVACIADSKGSELVLLNDKAQIVWHIGKRREQMRKIDEVTGLTNRQLLKKMRAD